MERGRPEIIVELMSERVREGITAADLIFGIDELTGNKFIVFGRSALKRLRDGSEESREFLICERRILQGTDELEYLIAAVQRAKGFDEYESFNEAVARN